MSLAKVNKGTGGHASCEGQFLQSSKILLPTACPSAESDPRLSILVLQDGSVVETGTHPELVELGGHYAEMWNRQKETGTIPRSISTASMSSATTSRAADGDGWLAGDHPRRVSRGIVGSLFGATQAMLGYGGGGQASHEPSHGAHESHG